MSTIKVSNLQNASAASPAFVLAADGSATANLSSVNGGPISGTRNRIINGDMRIDQRGGTVSATGGGAYGLDRWASFAAGGGMFTSVKDTSVPNGLFKNSVKLTVTTVDSSIAASDYYSFVQVVEGFNTDDLGWGTSDAKSATLSFWVRSSVTGTWAVALYNVDGSRLYPATFSISTADTWQYVALNVPGITSGTWNTTNGVGVGVRFDLGSGSSVNGTANTWNTAGGFAGARTSGSVNWIGTAGATFYITGVQLEPGSTPTPFERRSFGQELALCQRYYETGTGLLVAYYTGDNFGGGVLNYQFKVTKRSVPTVAPTAGTGVGSITTFSVSPFTDRFGIWWSSGATIGDFREFTFAASIEL